MLAVVQIVSNLCFCQPNCLATNWTAILCTWLVFTIYGPFEVWLCVSNSHLLRTNEAAVSIWPSIKERFVYLSGMFGGDHRITGYGYWNVLLPFKKNKIIISKHILKACTNVLSHLKASNEKDGKSSGKVAFEFFEFIIEMMIDRCQVCDRCTVWKP